MSLFWLEVVNDQVELDLLEGDEILVNPEEIPAANGKDLAVFEVNGEKFISRFTRYGGQFLILGEKIRTIRVEHVKIIGKVVAATNEKELSL